MSIINIFILGLLCSRELGELNLNEDDHIIQKKKQKYFFQIDYLKAFAIVSVILLHSTNRTILYQTYSQFHILQAVPIFFFILGINIGLSSSNKWYSKEYWKIKFVRYIIPFLVIYVVSLSWGMYDGYLYFGKYSLLGYLPTPGPGSYFVSILFQFILLLPLIYKLYLKNPKYMLIIMFSIDIGFQLAAPYLSFINGNLYSACILRYFSVIAMGLFLSTELRETGSITLKRYKFLLIGLIISIINLAMASTTWQPFPLFLDQWGHQNVLSFFYTAVMIIILIRLIPNKNENPITSFISLIGKASYHIFLVQILFFRFDLEFTGSIRAGLGNVAVVCLLGLGFYLLNNKGIDIIRNIKADN